MITRLIDAIMQDRKTGWMSSVLSRGLGGRSGIADGCGVRIVNGSRGRERGARGNGGRADRLLVAKRRQLEFEAALLDPGRARSRCDASDRCWPRSHANRRRTSALSLVTCFGITHQDHRSQNSTQEQGRQVSYHRCILLDSTRRRSLYTQASNRRDIGTGKPRSFPQSRVNNPAPIFKP
jgi:hypothetical protein